MATVTFGQLEPFKAEVESFASYKERFELYIQANSVAADKKVSVFLSVIGLEAYTLLHNLCSPQKPQEKSYDALVKLIKDHFEPEPLVIAQRFHFNRRNQREGETLSEYAAELRRMAAKCVFNADYLDDALRDRIVCGIRSEAIQRRLLSEADLTLKRALELSLAMETAAESAKGIKNQDTMEPAVHKVEQSNKRQGRRPCYRCGRSNHEPQHCRFREARCHRCDKVGHIATVCRSAKKPAEVNQQSGRQKKRAGGRQARQNLVAEDNSSESDDLRVTPIFVLGARTSKPIEVEMLLNDKPVRMELDTGAAVTIMSKRQQQALFPGASLHSSNVRLKSYTGEQVEVVGEMAVNVVYNNSEQKSLSLTVVSQEGPTLLGRNWLPHIVLDWKSISAVYTKTKGSSSLNTLLSDFSDIFNNELGTIMTESASGEMQPLKAKLLVRPNETPKFCKPRSLPFAIKSAIDLELDDLESKGIITPVSYSNWAAPIVTVPKKDGRFRICGDYKMTINPAMDIEQYPLPSPQSLFSTLAGGKSFTTLDLQQAYLQLPLDEESRELVTINTHRGLYQYTRLPFGVASAPALFQRTMDTILQGVPGVVCYIDDILVTGETDSEHLRNLELVLLRLKKHGVKLKRSKCRFMQKSVEYLGHRLDSEGQHPTDEKLRAVIDAPTPRNVQQLRSFLGLLNYYSKFVPNLASILYPLNQLLQKDRKWSWSSDCAKAFQEAKEGLISSQVLVHYDPSLPIKVAADASAYGLGAVISHVLPDQSERPIAYASRSLTNSEKNYAQIDKEALALVFSIKKFHQYLYGRKFTLLTDHKPLLSILGSKQGIPPLAAARLQRWAVILSAYTYDIVFKPTQDHCNADALSRLPLPETDTTSSSPSEFNISQIYALPVTSVSIQSCSRKDPILSKVLRYTKSGWPATVPDELKPFYLRRMELTVEAGCLLWGMRVIVPKHLQQIVLKELHLSHPGVSRMKSIARSYLWWPGLDKEIEKLVATCTACQAVRQAPAAAPLHPWIWHKTLAKDPHRFCWSIQRKILSSLSRRSL